MTDTQLERELYAMLEIMDGAIDTVTAAGQDTQSSIYKFLTDYINRFEIEDGRFVVNQDFTGRFAYIQRQMQRRIDTLFKPSITEYLSTYSKIEDINVSLQKSYNQLTVDVEKLSPARKSVYNQAAYYLKDGLAEAYVQPTKYLLMQQVTQGVTLKDSQRILKNWNKGDLSAGSQLTSGRATPNLTKYATQVARDSLHGYNGTINEVIATEYDLKAFKYVGDIIEDSRPFCRHLVGLKRTIKLSEVPGFVQKYPDGLKPNTTMKNFYVVRGGYACRHLAIAVRERS